MNSVIKYLVERLAERTTWVGLIAAAGVALPLASEELEAIGNLGVAAAAALLVFGKSRWFAPKEETPTV